jgi:2-keto-4-pentenoate hydratase/2-oxohepta-3-ene-1,7-dioic acid hydratase in catechol pathway
MRLVTFVPQIGATPRVGLLRNGNRIIDLTDPQPRPPFDPADMIALITAGDSARTWLRDVAAKSRESTPFDKVTLLAPIPRPRKNVFCVGWNYFEHFNESASKRPADFKLPDHPVFFTKAPTSVNGPYAAIPYQSEYAQSLDWEVELGVIIGRAGKNISEADAMKHVFGYTVVNDVTVRDIQIHHGGQWFRGKSLDGTCPMGPSIVTADEVDADNLRVVCRVNGVVKQDANTQSLFFKIPRLIAELSLGLTLEPGDIISTGTPSGVGRHRNPPEFMSPGDVMETEIVGLGLMRNAIAE